MGLHSPLRVSAQWRSSSGGGNARTQSRYPLVSHQAELAFLTDAIPCGAEEMVSPGSWPRGSPAWEVGCRQAALGLCEAPGPVSPPAPSLCFPCRLHARGSMGWPPTSSRWTTGRAPSSRAHGPHHPDAGLRVHERPLLPGRAREGWGLRGVPFRMVGQQSHPLDLS